MLGTQRDHELLVEEVMPGDSWRVLARPDGILVGDGEIQLACGDTGRELTGGALVEGHFGIRMIGAQAGDRGRHETGQGARQRADPQPRPLAVCQFIQLGLGEPETLGDGIGVLEQNVTFDGETEPSRPPLE
jgi:hypothetical protein